MEAKLSAIEQPIDEIEGLDPARFREEVVGRPAPVVLRGLVAGWPAVQAARRSNEEAAAYLQRFDRGAPVEAFVGPPEIGGRFFYAPDLAGFNFERQRSRLADILRYLLTTVGDDNARAVYV